MSGSGSKLVQYIVVRGDLSNVLNWPTGAVIAQACHACTAVIWEYRDDENTKEYTKYIDHMHKVVLEVSEEQTLLSVYLYGRVKMTRIQRYIEKILIMCKCFDECKVVTDLIIFRDNCRSDYLQ